MCIRDRYFTSDTKTVLPKGTHETFPLNADGEWQQVSVAMKTDKRIHQLRLDVCEDVGSATIADLSLVGSDGKVLIKWPAKKKRPGKK